MVELVVVLVVVDVDVDVDVVVVVAVDVVVVVVVTTCSNKSSGYLTPHEAINYRIPIHNHSELPHRTYKLYPRSSSGNRLIRPAFNDHNCG